jgi:hypothetical protein
MRNPMIIVNILLVVMGGLAAAAESETDVRTAYRNESCACQTQECLIDVENRYARQFGGMKTDPIHVTEAQRLMDEAAKCHTDILAKMPAARTNQRRSEDREAERRKIIRQGPGMAAP